MDVEVFNGIQCLFESRFISRYTNGGNMYITYIKQRLFY